MAAATTARRSYVDTSAGQIHSQEAGAGPAVVLLHWGPRHGEQYLGVEYSAPIGIALEANA
jgi:hypothetical protein